MLSPGWSLLFYSRGLGTVLYGVKINREEVEGVLLVEVRVGTCGSRKGKQVGFERVTNRTEAQRRFTFVTTD